MIKEVINNCWIQIKTKRYDSGRDYVKPYILKHILKILENMWIYFLFYNTKMISYNFFKLYPF